MSIELRGHGRSGGRRVYVNAWSEFRGDLGRFVALVSAERPPLPVFLPGISMTWAIDAPVHVVIVMERSFVTHRLAACVSGVDYPWVDIGIAGEHLVLAATELGLGTCWIGWIRPRVVAKLVGWSAFVKPVVVITVGYPTEADPGFVPASRRKPLAELVRWL